MGYKVGEKVRIKSLVQLVNEFGTDACGDIELPHTMVIKDMGRYCGEEATIATVLENARYKIEEDNGAWVWDEEAFMPATSMVDHPAHYNDGKIEVIDFIEDKGLGFHLGNAVKYISRAGKKDKNKTIEDIRKAIWYLERYLEVNTNLY